MLRDDPAPMQPPTRSICLVLPLMRRQHDAADILAHDALVTKKLGPLGWRIHVLLCPFGEDVNEAQARAILHASGAKVASLSDFPLARPLALKGPEPLPEFVIADHVRHALETLQGTQRFDVIEFADRGALGLRAIQAKRAGLAFDDMCLVVKMHGPSVVLDEHNLRWIEGPKDLAWAHCEQQAYAQADCRATVSSALADEARRHGWDAAPSAILDDACSAQRLADYYAACRPPKAWAACSDNTPLVTIGVAHYNLGAFLPETLASIAAQTYPELEVIIVDDGSTDPASQHVVTQMQARYPAFRFIHQANAGIGATRNHILRLARGDYFLPMDADNVAQPNMVRRFVTVLERCRGSAAATCYFRAFAETGDLATDDFLYAYRPLGGSRLLAALRNVYGDGNALFRTEALRGVGGFETDRDTSWEDWEVFVKLANQGHAIEVVPEFLFSYRHREAGFSRATQGYRNQQRVLRRFPEMRDVTSAESRMLWQALAGFERRLAHLENENNALKARLGARRHRLADWLHRLVDQR